MVAAKDPKLAFIVLLAGPGVSGGDIIVRQAMLGAKAAGLDYKQVEADQRAIIEIVKTSADTAGLHRRVAEAIASYAKRDGTPPPSAQALEAAADALDSPWYRYFVSHDPRPNLAAVRCPILALNGELDLQVDASQNLPVIAKTAKHAEVHLFPGLNHLFQTAQTGALSEYANIEETIAPIVLEKVSSWVLSTVATNSQ
jgi:hypothetical protein